MNALCAPALNAPHLHTCTRISKSIYTCLVVSLMECVYIKYIEFVDNFVGSLLVFEFIVYTADLWIILPDAFAPSKMDTHVRRS